MKLLNRDKWWIWLVLLFFSEGTSTIVLGALLDIYKKNSWYTKWYYWLIGLLLIIPFPIMIASFYIQIICLIASKLDVSGKELYLSPYIWILLIIIPLIGWVFFIVLYLYLQIDILIKLHDGEAEKYK